MIRHRRPQTGPSVEHSNTDAYTPAEGAELLCRLAEQKALQPYDHIFLKAFLGGVYLSFGGFLYLIVGGGSAGLTASNPGLVRIIEGLVFPVGLVLIVLTGTELFTGNMCVVSVLDVADRY
jgi:formate/nitrite transporter FocA (FNT family)